MPYANRTKPQTLNLYAMVAEDPESFADLDGHFGSAAQERESWAEVPRISPYRKHEEIV